MDFEALEDWQGLATQSLSFVRNKGSETVSELRWDCVELKRLLNDHECTDNLREVVSKIISVNHEIKPKEDDPERFLK